MVVIARRGLIQSAFSLKELRDLYNLENEVEFYLYKPDLERCLNDNSIEEIEARDG